MKKIIMAVVIILIIAIPITVFAVIGTGQQKEQFSQTALEELEKKQEFIDSGKSSLTARNGEEQNNQSLTQEEKEILNAKLEDAEQREVIIKDYVERTVAVINQTLGKNYGVELEFNYDLMRAAVDTVKTGRLTAEEETLLKGYIGEYCCGVLGTDPMYDEIMDILDLPY